MQNIKNDTYCSSTSHTAKKKNAECRDATSTTTRHNSVAAYKTLLPGGCTKKKYKKRKPYHPEAAQKSSAALRNCREVLLPCGNTKQPCSPAVAQ